MSDSTEGVMEGGTNADATGPEVDEAPLVASMFRKLN
jgi:hypothetical protein